MKDQFRRYRKNIAPYYYETGFNPFSHSFSAQKVKEHAKKLNNKFCKEEIDSLLKFEIFNGYHNALFERLEKETDKLATTKEDFIRSVIALANEQYFIIDKQMRENLPGNNASALDFRNITIESDNFPDNPQVLNGGLENTIEFLNLLINYIKRKKLAAVKSDMTTDEVVRTYEAIFKNANEYRELKHHFESCLSGAGKMEFDEGKVKFYLIDTGIGLSQLLMEVHIENNSNFARFSFLNQIKKTGIVYLEKKEYNLVLDELSFINNEFGYKLRGRENSELLLLYSYEVFIKDYYPHLTEIVLNNLVGLTLRDLLHLTASMVVFAQRLMELLGNRKTKQNIDSIKNNYAPLIPEKLFIDYLINVSGLTELQIRKYLEIQTNSWSDNLYAKPLIKIDNSYVFPFLPITGSNPYFLLDHWLEVAEISLDQRGYKFQDIVKDELKNFKDKKYNKYKVIEENKIKCSLKFKKEEEIDLIVELRDVLLIGEVKCIKYPMSERDCFDGLNDRVDGAITQLIVKERFLRKNADEIKTKYNFDANKKIVKVVVLNYPVYTCYTIKGIPIVDYKTLITYFHSSGFSIKSMNEDEMEVVHSEQYYTSEDSFNRNIENYLFNAPVHSYFKNGLENRDLKYNLPFLGLEISFNDYRKR